MSKSILIAAFDAEIHLTQHIDLEGFVDYTVQYGKQVTAGLTYSQAAHELGCCILHSLTCACLIDCEEDVTC